MHKYSWRHIYVTAIAGQAMADVIFMVKELPKNVQDLFNDQQAVKVLATASTNGLLHVVPLGSLAAPAKDTIIFAKIIANETHANLEEALKRGSMVSALAVKGGEAYQVRCKPKTFATAGPLLDGMNEKLKARGMKAAGVWVLEPVEVLNQSPGPNAGKPM
jgi:hypothetical protein